MGAPVILIEKLCSGQETLLSLQRLRQVVASGVCEGQGAGRVGNEKVHVEEKTYTYPMDHSQFPIWLAKDEDLQKIDVNDPNLPPVSHIIFIYVQVCIMSQTVLGVYRNVL